MWQLFFTHSTDVGMSKYRFLSKPNTYEFEYRLGKKIRITRRLSLRMYKSLNNITSGLYNIIINNIIFM